MNRLIDRVTPPREQSSQESSTTFVEHLEKPRAKTAMPSYLKRPYSSIKPPTSQNSPLDKWGNGRCGVVLV